jgi:hypothetical protein
MRRNGLAIFNQRSSNDLYVAQTEFIELIIKYKFHNLYYKYKIGIKKQLMYVANSKIKHAKNVYRNWLTDSHLNDFLRVVCSTYKPDIPKYKYSK